MTAISHADIPKEWIEEFDAAARRPLEVRMRYAFIHTYKPVLDDADFRAFEFARDGIERFEDAWSRHVDVEGFPVCHIDDIIASKIASNRQKDRETLPRLHAFSAYWKACQS